MEQGSIGSTNAKVHERILSSNSVAPTPLLEEVDWLSVLVVETGGADKCTIPTSAPWVLGPHPTCRHGPAVHSGDQI